MVIVVSTATWYNEDQARVEAFERSVRAEAANHEVVVVPPGADLLAEMKRAHAFFPLSGRSLSEEVLAAAPDLRWVHLASAGVDHALYPSLLNRPITLTNAAGVYAVPIAEHVLALMLALSRGIPTMVRQQDRREWDGVRGGELEGRTALVVGLGGIGLRVAAVCRGVGMRVTGIRRNPCSSVEGVDRVYSPDQLGDAISEADWMIVCAPLTAETRGMIGAREFARAKSSTRIVNIARGEILDEEALIEALRDGRIAGAGLDVFDDEPLPQDSPLWDMPNVIVSPHSAGSSPRSLERTLDLFLENLRRFVAGEPLLNVVDKVAGY